MKFHTCKNGAELIIDDILAIDKIENDISKINDSWNYKIHFKYNTSIDIRYDNKKDANSCRKKLIENLKLNS